MVGEVGVDGNDEAGVAEGAKILPPTVLPVDVLVGVVAGVGVVGAGAETSVPIGANGFGLPSLPSAVRVILESRNVSKATSAKIESSNLILFILKSTFRNSLDSTDPWLKAPKEESVELDEVETNASCSGPFLIKKIYTNTRMTAATMNIIIFLNCDMLIF